MSSLDKQMDHLNLLGKRIRKLRGKRTREVVAEAADISPGYLGELERGEKWPSLELLLKLADVLGVPLVELFELEAEQTNRAILIEAINIRLKKMDTSQLQQAFRFLRSFV